MSNRKKYSIEKDGVHLRDIWLNDKPDFMEMNILSVEEDNGAVWYLDGDNIIGETDSGIYKINCLHQ